MMPYWMWASAQPGIGGMPLPQQLESWASAQAGMGGMPLPQQWELESELDFWVPEIDIARELVTIATVGLRAVESAS